MGGDAGSGGVIRAGVSFGFDECGGVRNSARLYLPVLAISTYPHDFTQKEGSPTFISGPSEPRLLTMSDTEPDTDESDTEFIALRAAPRAPPTAAPPAKLVGDGASSDDILRAPPVTMTIQTAPMMAKMRICCISIFALYADY